MVEVDVRVVGVLLLLGVPRAVDIIMVDPRDVSVVSSSDSVAGLELLLVVDDSRVELEWLVWLLSGRPDKIREPLRCASLMK